MLDELKQVEPILNGWVIDHENYTKLNKEVYHSPSEFYQKYNFEIINETRLEIPILRR